MVKKEKKYLWPCATLSLRFPRPPTSFLFFRCQDHTVPGHCSSLHAPWELMHSLSDSQPGALLPSRRHLAILADIFGCPSQVRVGRQCYCHLLVETRDVANNPAMHRPVPMANNYPAPDVLKDPGLVSWRDQGHTQSWPKAINAEFPVQLNSEFLVLDFSLGHSWCGSFEKYGEITQESRPQQGLEYKGDFTAGETRDTFPGRASCVV